MGDVERADSTVMDVHMEICMGCNQVVAWENMDTGGARNVLEGVGSQDTAGRD